MFNSDGSFSREFGGLGNGDGQLNYPAALEFNFDGELVVVDRKNHRIQMLDPLTGKCIWKFGTFGRADGLVSEPSGVAIDDDANYIITDSGNNRLQFFTSKGIWFKTFKSDEFPFNWPVCISYSQGRVYICDYNAHRIRVFSWAQGEIKHALTFGDSPNGDYREDLDYCSAAFSFPIGILTDRDGKVFVSDERHIQCFSPEGMSA